MTATRCASAWRRDGARTTYSQCDAWSAVQMYAGIPHDMCWDEEAAAALGSPLVSDTPASDMPVTPAAAPAPPAAAASPVPPTDPDTRAGHPDPATACPTCCSGARLLSSAQGVITDGSPPGARYPAGLRCAWAVPPTPHA